MFLGAAPSLTQNKKFYIPPSIFLLLASSELGFPPPKLSSTFLQTNFPPGYLVSAPKVIPTQYKLSFFIISLVPSTIWRTRRNKTTFKPNSSKISKHAKRNKAVHWSFFYFFTICKKKKKYCLVY